MQPSTSRTIIKVLSTLALALISALHGGPLLLTIALGFGAIGDGFLSLRDEKGFLPGLGAFLVGHICFVMLFLSLGQGIEHITVAPWRMITAILMVLYTFYMGHKLIPRLGSLKVPVLLYIFVIFCMGLATLTLQFSWPLYLTMFGALLFIISDSILAHELFIIEKGNPILKVTAPVLWFSYWGGQALIAAGILL
ncbi:MAG: lysoplasmalogenase [Rhizobiaceae bacterium]